MRHTKIVATIGPASDHPAMLRQLVAAGVDVARLNLSHGVHEEHRQRFQRIRAAAQEVGKFVPIIWDTKGPEIRLGVFAAGKVELRSGQLFALWIDDRPGDQQGVSVSYRALPEELAVGDRVLVDDGLLEMQVEAIDPEQVTCRVLVGGTLSNRKGVNIPGRSLNLPALSDQDRADIRLGVELGCDYIAQSFVRSAADILVLRKLLEELGENIPIIAKIENRQGVENMAEILKVADGVMVARGDMGVEIPTEEVPLIQKEMIAACNRLGKPVITATQMLDSMIRAPRPTRAEASDVANAILDGTDAVMLSGETASGKYPLEAVRTMARIAMRAEQALQHAEILRQRRMPRSPSVTDAISHATVQAATDLGAKAIITSTQSGSTARMVSRYRPQAPVLAFTYSEQVARRLNLSWGVHPMLGERTQNTDQMVNAAIARALDLTMIKNGDLIVLTAGVPVGVPGTTNLLKVHIVGDVLAKGMGIGQKPVTGKAVVCRNAREALQKATPGCIVVTVGTDKEYIPALERACGLVAEEGGLTSHAAVVALNLGLPVIVGVAGATSRLSDGQLITLDTARGLIYRGQANIPASE
ncbi:MAG: pyruvate kinase [Bacillota bacterium]